MKNRLEINWEKDRPTNKNVVQMWKDLDFKSLNNWTKSTEILIKKFDETHINGGIQLHKFQISDNEYFNWFASRNRLDEIYFTKRLFERTELKYYRKNLGISSNKPFVNQTNWHTDIFDLAGIIARFLGHGGAYENLNASESWKTAIEFVNDEFENRFDEFNRFTFTIKEASWFYDIAWDYSFLLFDKRKNQIIIFDITDTD